MNVTFLLIQTVNITFQQGLDILFCNNPSRRIRCIKISGPATANDQRRQLEKGDVTIHAWGESALTEREKNVLNIYLNGYEGKISSKNWAHLAKCSSDTANRDLQDLCQKGLIACDDENAKRRTYHLITQGMAG